MSDVNRLRFPEDVKIATGIGDTARNAAFLQGFYGSVDGVSLGDAAEIDPGTSPPCQTIIRQQKQIFERCIGIEAHGAMRSGKKACFDKSAAHRDVERASGKPAQPLRATEDFVGALIHVHNFTRGRAIEARHVTVLLVKAHQLMDRCDFTKSRFDPHSGIGSNGADFH